MCERRNQLVFGGRIQLSHLCDYGKSQRRGSISFLVKQGPGCLTILEECCNGQEERSFRDGYCEEVLTGQA